MLELVDCMSGPVRACVLSVVEIWMSGRSKGRTRPGFTRVVPSLEVLCTKQRNVAWHPISPYTDLDARHDLLLVGLVMMPVAGPVDA